MYKEGKDQSALDWMTSQGAVDKKSGKDTNIRDMTDPTSAVNLNMGTLVGSFACVAAMLDEIDTVPGCEGVLLTFDDFIQGMDDFGQKIQPLMASRQHLTSAEAVV
jgi:pyrimidine oxygenase